MRILLTCLITFLSYQSFSQPVKIYNPDADAATEINRGILQAKAENKNIFLQIGGNWCPWCLKFHKLYQEDQNINALMSKSYVFILINYSKENRNYAILKKLDYPQRFGFPVFVILDPSGKRIHTQNSSYLEEGERYSTKGVLEFLKQWSPEALDPLSYKEI